MSAMMLLFAPESYTMPARPAVRAAAQRPSVVMAEGKEQVLDRYMSLDVKGKVQAEYLFIDAYGDVRSKCRTVDASKAKLGELPDWNYDGSSTDQAPGEDSEVIIKPRAIYKDPFRGGDNILVLTDTYTPAGESLPTNTRVPAMEKFAGAGDEAPWFGLEQ